MGAPAASTSSAGFMLLIERPDRAGRADADDGVGRERQEVAPRLAVLVMGTPAAPCPP